MPELKIGDKTVEVENEKRLVLAIEEAGINIGHRCGGNSRCTTCRVEFLEGEPETMTRAEYEKLKAVNLLGKARLSCQIVVDRDMSVKPLVLLEDQNWADTGPTPDAEVQPQAEWFPRDALQAS